MFTGVSKKKAIKAWMIGKDVRVLDRNATDSDGNIALIPLDNLFNGYEFLVDVLATVNPEFEEAIGEMVSKMKIAPAQKEN